MTSDDPGSCDCPAAGYCPRYQRTVSARLRHLCQTRADYRAHLLTLAAGQPPPPAPPSAAAGPGLLARAWGFVRSLARHAAGGFARVTRQQLEARLAACRACPHYKPEAEACGLCGCCATARDAWLNKLAWRHERCPADPPRW